MNQPKLSTQNSKKSTRSAKSNKQGNWQAHFDRETAICQIDDLVFALGTGGRLSLIDFWAGDVEQAVTFARRGLQVAIAQAIDARNDANLQPIINEAESIADAAKVAEKSIEKLMRLLAGGHPKAAINLVDGLRVMRPSLLMNATEANAMALKNAGAIWDSLGVVKGVRKTARHKIAILKKDRRNPGSPDDRVFAIVIGEIWIRLTGQRPTANPKGSAFQSFLAAAWLDAGRKLSEDQEDQSVSSLLRMAQEARRAYEPDQVKAVVEASGEPIVWRQRIASQTPMPPF